MSAYVEESSVESYSADSKRDIRRHLLSGFAWSMMDAGVVQVTQIVSGLVLVRLLSPHDYGLAGMVLIFSSLVLFLSDLQMGAALVQRPKITEADCSTVFWSSVVMGVCLTVGGIALSGPLADFYGQPAVRPLFAAVSLSFLLVALSTTPASLMQREMRFRVIHIRIATATVVASAAGLTAAALGAGAWALIIQQISASAAATVLIWAKSAWRPSFTFSRHSFRALGGYGFNLLGSTVVGYIKNNADNLLVGRFLGSAALGAYAVGYNLMFLPLERVVSPIHATLFPAFSRWQHDTDRLATTWLRVMRAIAAFLAPALLGFVVVAPDFVTAIMGNKWRAAVPVLRLLAIVALAQGLAMQGQRILSALDRTRTVLRFALLESTLTVTAFAVGLRWGIVGVAACYVVVSVPLQIAFIALTAKVLGVSLLRVARTLAGVAAATACMVSACVGLQFALGAAHVSALPRLILVVTAGVVVYVVASWIVNPELVGELRELRRVRSASSGGEALALAA